MSSQIKSSQNKIEFANSLRGIAAISVLIAHFLGVFWADRRTAGALANTLVPSVEQVPTPDLLIWLLKCPVSWGPFGVSLFFLISGFVIPFSIINSNTKAFLIGRFFRIYPLYIAGFSVTLIALFISGIISGFAFPYTFKQVAFHYLPGVHAVAGTAGIDGIIWTLEIEIAFYLVCAIFSNIMKKGSLVIFILPIFMFVFVFLFCNQTSSALLKLLSNTSQFMILMFIGVAFNYLFRRIVSLKLFLPIVFLLGSLFIAGMFINKFPPVMTISYTAAFCVFSLSAITSKFWKKNTVLSFTANISYPLYVIHAIMGYAILAHLTSAGINPLISIFIATTTSIIIAWILHKLIENPSHAFGKRMATIASKRSQIITTTQ